MSAQTRTAPTINLLQFCALWHPTIANIHRPWIADGDTWATDGKILVRVWGEQPGIDGAGDPYLLEAPVEILDLAHRGWDVREADWLDPDRLHWLAPKLCETCEGARTVRLIHGADPRLVPGDNDPGGDNPCPTCRATGVQRLAIPIDWRSGVGITYQDLARLLYLSELFIDAHKLHDADAWTTGRNGLRYPPPLPFTFKGGCGMFAPAVDRETYHD